MTARPIAFGLVAALEPLPLDRKKKVAYPNAAMKRFCLSRIVYILLLALEILKAACLGWTGLSSDGGRLEAGSVFAYASIAALCLPPVMLFMLIASERAFSFCLPLLAIEKGCSLLSFAFLLARAVRSPALAVPQVSNFGFIFCAIIACAAGDLILLIFCLWRRRKVCG